MAGVLELSASRLEAAMIKILQGTIIDVLEINENKSQQRNRRYKEKPHEILEDRNTTAKKKKNQCTGSTADWSGERRDSVYRPIEK